MCLAAQEPPQAAASFCLPAPLQPQGDSDGLCWLTNLKPGFPGSSLLCPAPPGVLSWGEGAEPQPCWDNPGFRAGLWVQPGSQLWSNRVQNFIVEVFSSFHIFMFSYFHVFLFFHVSMFFMFPYFNVFIFLMFSHVFIFSRFHVFIIFIFFIFSYAHLLIFSYFSCSHVFMFSYFHIFIFSHFSCFHILMFPCSHILIFSYFSCFHVFMFSHFHIFIFSPPFPLRCGAATSFELG